MKCFKKNTISRFVLGLLVAISIGSCGSANKAIKNYVAATDLSGLVEDKSQAPTILYVRADAPTLGSYDTFIIDPIILDPRDASIKKLKTEDLTRIQNYFTKSLTGELENKGYTISDKASDKAMRMTFILSGIKVPNASANVTSV